ncbi:glycosyltransferase [Rothia sp. LK2588]|uniref:glycosyltransferase n=1 Tax=Rothia sp. LK2588 TaxID=3114369 RepID=UPI0034CF0F52
MMLSTMFHSLTAPLRGKAATAELAIAHDYLTQRGGAERVVLSMHQAFPEATIYTTLYDPENTYPEFKDAKIVVSPLNKVAVFRKNHRLALPLLPIASSLLRVPAKKALVSSTGWAHGFNFTGQSYIYCHSPARWLYLTDQYLGDHSGRLATAAIRVLRPALIRWDQWAARKAGPYVANSTTISRRIANVYDKLADVIFPPYSVAEDAPEQPIAGLEDFLADGDYFLIVSRLLPYKNVDKAVEAFSGSDKKLLVIGAGPMADELRAMSGENVQFASNISDAELRYAYHHCAALLAVSYEDFGLTPLEVGSFGKPTIALHAGGYLDTITPGLNGSFIDESTPAEIRNAVFNFDAGEWDAAAIKEHMRGFSEERFIRQLRVFLDSQ